MSVPIEINVTISSDNLSEQLIPKVRNLVQSSIQSSLAIIKDEWQSSVQKQLNSTRAEYLQGLSFDSVIYPHDGYNFTGAVQLNGKFANMLETGYPAFDLKIGFSKSDKKIQKKNGGWYLTIPMRHSTPGRFMYGSPMPRSVYNKARQLPDKGRLHYPGLGDVSWNGYQRKHTTYDGLTRIIKSYAKTDKSSYYTFRRVSDKSDPASWFHPGFKGVKAADNLRPFAEKTFLDMLNANLKDI